MLIPLAFIIPCFAQDIAPIEQTVIDLINAEREALGRPLLEADGALSGVARSHSYEMVKENYFGHKSRTTGGPLDRARQARIPTKSVYEHITKATSAIKAHQQLMLDKAYSSNIVERDYERIGVGMFSPDGENYHVTILLSVPIHSKNFDKLMTDFVAGVNADRRSLNLPEMELSKDLNRVALDAARFMNQKGLLFVGDTITTGMKSIELSYRSYRTKYWFITSIEKARKEKLLSEAIYTLIGLGVLPNDNPKKGAGSLWVVMILAQPK
ncbi:MAG: CAP domain-containing protein [Planctomycetota bacterium]|nr:CAP domain-containing protein [Planctomycetota bacterium]